jgi:hypothetical protein
MPTVHDAVLKPALAADRLAAAALAALMLAFAPRPASADWPLFGRAISNTVDSQIHPEIASDGAGGALIAWQDFRKPQPEIAVNHVLASGALDANWPHFGRSVVTDPVAIADAVGGQSNAVIVSDGAGGAIVAWEDLRSADTEFDIFATHLLANGQVDPAWTVNGTALSVIDGAQNAPQIVADGAGGAIVTWQDQRAGASVTDVYAQHVLASGVVDPRWPVNGLAVGAAPGPQELPAISADGAGGAIIVWQDQRGLPSGFDVFAQHVLNSGIVDARWPVNGLGVCTANGDQGRATILSDGGTGAIVVWTDGRFTNADHIFADHVLATGVVDPAWPVNGRQLSNAAVLESRPRAASDGAGGALVSWQGFTTQLNIFAQHVKANGVVDPAWPAAGRALSDATQLETTAEVAADGAGGVIVAWQDGPRVIAQHVLANSTFDPAYPATGLALADPNGGQGDPAIVSAGLGGAIVTWTDSRDAATTGQDIYAIQVLAVQTLDVSDPPSTALRFARPNPNPARDPLTLRYALAREASVALAVYDPAGRRVRQLVSGREPAGEHAVVWDLRDERGGPVGSGVYFARLESGGEALIQKVMRVK